MYSIKLGCGHMHCGENAVRTLADLPAQQAGLHCHERHHPAGPGPAQDGHRRAGGRGLHLEGAIPTVEPEPSFRTVLRGAEDMAAFEPDWVIGLGGGSAMDAAKAMWVFYENPEYRELEDVMPPNEIRISGRRPGCAASPPRRAPAARPPAPLSSRTR